MDIHSQLKIAGLNNSEISVYLFLLENGLSSPPLVSRGTKIARTNCYNILEELKEKGLVLEKEEGLRKAYMANSPESILASIEKKKEAIRQVLPDLNNLYTTHKNKPKIKFYEGLDEIKEIYRSALESSDITILHSYNDPMVVMPSFYKEFIQSAEHSGIIIRTITNKNISALAGNLLSEAGEVSVLPEQISEQPLELVLWKDNIAFICLNEPAIGTLIHSQLMATTIKVLIEPFIKVTPVRV